MNDGAFGEIVYEYMPGADEHLTLCTGGFRGVQRGQEIAARWEDIAFVRRSHVRLIVLGMHRDNVRAEIHLPDGRAFIVDGHGEAATLAAQTIARLSGPVLAARMMAQLSAPGGVMFGTSLRASQEGLHFRRGSQWKTLRFDEIAGYKVYQGHLLIDENPLSPRLAQQLRLATLQNSDALLMLLSVMAPDKDLDLKPYPAAPSFFATTAATHDPRYLSMRARGIGCLAFVGLGVVAGIVFLIVNGYYRSKDQAAMAAANARAAQYRAALDVKVKAFATAPVPTGTLREACAPKPYHTDDMLFVMAGADPAATGLTKEPMPWYADSGYDGFDIPRQKVEYPSKTTILVKALPGTALDDKTTPRARLHVQVFGDPAEAPVCEGIAEASWTLKSYGTNDDHTREEGLFSTVALALCSTTSSDGPCKRARSPLYPKEVKEGPPPAPSSSASASAGPNKGKAPPKKK